MYGRAFGQGQAGIEIAARFGQHQLSQQIRPRLRDTKRDVAAPRMAHEIDRTGPDLLDEGDHVGNMLRHLVVLAGSVPMLGKEMPQADRDQAMVPRQRAEHRIPGAEIAERAVHTDQRMASSYFEIGHVVTVDAECLHDQLARKSRTTSEYFCGACSNIGCVAFGMIAVLE